MLTQAELDWLMEPTTSWLEGSTIQRVYGSVQPHEWCLLLRRPGESRYLVLCTEPDAARLHFTRDGKPPQPQHPTSFTMLLRKWLQGMVIREVIAPDHDRVVRLRGDVRAPTEESRQRDDEDDTKEEENTSPAREPIELVIELHGTHAMLFLLRGHEAGTILGQSSTDRLPGRSLQPGHAYTALPQDPFDTDQIKAQNRFLDHTLSAEARALIEPAPLPEEDHDELTRRHDLVDDWFRVNLANLRKQNLIDILQNKLRRHEKKLARLVRNIEGDLQRVEEAQQWKKYGELLQSAYGKVKRGASGVKVTDYYTEGLPEIEIPLQEELSLQQNIDHYFKQYKRLHDATDRIEERLLEKMELLEEVRRWRDDVRDMIINEEEGWQDLEETLSSRGLLGQPKQRPVARNKHGQVIKREPYRRYVGSKGSTIFVGKGARGNDMVSLKIARGRDLWFHARDWAGAHVILRMEKNQDQPHQAEVLDAAMLAAHFSKGRADTKVDVTQALAKYVRKPKGYPVGMVTVGGGSTILVELDPGRLERLLATEVSE